MPTKGAIDWRSDAACLDTDPEQFHSVKSTEREYAVRTFCRHCPVRETCREDAFGWKETERRQLVAGGWNWDARGVVTPFTGEGHLLARLNRTVARV